MTFDIHSETLSLYRELNLIPAVCPVAIAEKFLERGAELSTEQLIVEMKKLNTELIALQANSR